MNDQTKKILERYGYLKKEIALSYLGNPKLEQLKLEMAKVLFDMEIYDLTPQDYIDFKKKNIKLAQQHRLAEKHNKIKKAWGKGIFLLIMGLFMILIGIGLSELTNGGIIFYGFIFVGIGLILLGSIEFYAVKIMK